MFNQEPKTKIDTGEQGNSSTGDILYDGGNKINSNMDAIYNMFGDQRFYNQGAAEGNQTIHATGYYQKVGAFDFPTPAPLGTMWDVDCSNGSVAVTVQPGKVGECIVVVNSLGNCSTSTPIVVRLTGAGSFVGIGRDLVITRPFCRVECWCIGIDASGTPIWNFSQSSMFGSTEVPIEKTIKLDVTKPNVIPIAHVDEYTAIKLLINVSDTANTQLRQSEALLLIESRPGVQNVHHTEYAVIRAGQTVTDPDNLVNIKYEVGTGSIVNLVATTSKVNMRIAVKSIATQKIGSA